MQYIILDLEWNLTFSAKKKRYFNEIIEIGAARLNEQRELQDTFQAYVGAQISKELTSRVVQLTNITFDRLENGEPFSRIISKFSRWIGSEETIVMTWSDTDLHVLLENYLYYDPHADSIPFMKRYVDLQKYCQAAQGLSLSQQVGLANLAELIEVPVDDLQQHSARDDSIISVRCFQKLFREDLFSSLIRNTEDPEFYRRMLFKNTFISDIHSEEIDQKLLRFHCKQCGSRAKRATSWHNRHNAFFAEFCCPSCGLRFTARVQAKKTYDAVRVTRRVLPLLPPKESKAPLPATPEKK